MEFQAINFTRSEIVIMGCTLLEDYNSFKAGTKCKEVKIGLNSNRLIAGKRNLEFRLKAFVIEDNVITLICMKQVCIWCGRTHSYYDQGHKLTCNCSEE